jgi:hypothetical protein
MVEDEGKQDEPKIEFDSAGESLAYISLDQARVLALQHARDKRDVYGRYADQEITWEELSAEESEDYYRIRLAYRPLATSVPLASNSSQSTKRGQLSLGKSYVSPVWRAASSPESQSPSFWWSQYPP